MELKELTAKVIRLFSCDDVKNLSHAIMDSILGENAASIYDRYLELCPDLTVDWMQRIYQFYLADREDKKQDYTPVCLSKLVACLTSSADEHVVYDCCCGSGSLSIQKWVNNKNLEFVLEELDDNVIPILLFNLCIRNIKATVVNKDILSNRVIKSWKTVPGERYASILQPLFPENASATADTAISNPPFNISVPVDATIAIELPDKYTCNFAFAQHCLQRSNGLSAVILPAGVLTSKKEMECRKHLFESGMLKAAIILPEKLFESTSVTTCILLLDKKKRSKDVMLVDATGVFTLETREQRGEGDTHYQRVYKKIFNTFTDEQILAICGFVETEQEGYSKLVEEEQLKEKGYSFCMSQYLQPSFAYTQHRDFNAIIRDINNLTREKNVLKISVNKVWAKELGLEEIIEQCKADEQIINELNESFTLFDGYKVEENLMFDKYIQPSNSKVFLIENVDKHVLSSIMPFFMNMWKQHIFYLNNEQNKLLMELRDSLLPFLMDGTISLSGTTENDNTVSEASSIG